MSSDTTLDPTKNYGREHTCYYDQEDNYYFNLDFRGPCDSSGDKMPSVMPTEDPANGESSTEVPQTSETSYTTWVPETTEKPMFVIQNIATCQKNPFYDSDSNLQDKYFTGSCHYRYPTLNFYDNDNCMDTENTHYRVFRLDENEVAQCQYDQGINLKFECDHSDYNSTVNDYNTINIYSCPDLKMTEYTFPDSNCDLNVEGFKSKHMDIWDLDNNCAFDSKQNT